MANLLIKFDKFRSSVSYFAFNLTISCYCGFNVLNKILFAETLDFEFYSNVFLFLSLTYSSYIFGEMILHKLNQGDLFLSLSKNLSGISKFSYSVKTQKEVFDPIIADWQEEYFEALFKKEIWKARWINVRYTYAFIVAMWQKSPIGDLIEFVRKIAR